MSTDPAALFERLRETIRQAATGKRPLRLRGGGSKDFYGEPAHGEPLDIGPYRGVVAYHPTELCITARAGTPLLDIETLLAEHNQILAFEPPYFSASATLGGCIAAGLSGPRRPYTGAVRDYVLGARLIDGRGQPLRFGGQVMKNVAGYDVSRLMAGSMGCLGVITEVTLKVIPKPAAELTLRYHVPDTAQALHQLNTWAGQPLPLSASCLVDGLLTVRLSGSVSGVQAARHRLGGERVANADLFWSSLREQTHSFFQTATDLWRLSMPATTPPLDLPGAQLIEWGGALRWLQAEGAATEVRRLVTAAGGHATLFRAVDKTVGVFQPLPPALLRLQQRLKQQFDPERLFNPGRLYPAL